jgi:hypothetical protein
MKLRGENRSTKTCPSATLSTTNPTWTEPGSNPGLRGGRPAVNRLSHGTALRLGLPSGLSPSGFPTKSMYTSHKQLNKHYVFGRLFSKLWNLVAARYSHPSGCHGTRISTLPYTLRRKQRGCSLCGMLHMFRIDFCFHSYWQKLRNCAHASLLHSYI